MTIFEGGDVWFDNGRIGTYWSGTIREPADERLIDADALMERMAGEPFELDLTPTPDGMAFFCCQFEPGAEHEHDAATCVPYWITLGEE